MRRPIRVFIVDDSAIARMLLRKRLHDYEGLVIVGDARDGREALVRIPASDADIVLMDLMLPGMDGLTVAEELMAGTPRPIVVISDLGTRDAATGFRALQAGVLEMMRKPTAAELDDEATRRSFARKIRMLAGVPVVTRHRRPLPDRSAPASPASLPPPRPLTPQLLCVGASTGGPPALLTLFSGLGGPPSCPVLLVQHMAPGFIEGMARWLGEATGIPFRMAADGDYLVPGTVLVAPDDRHLTLRGSRVVLADGPPLSGHRPSVDALFDSVAASAVADSAVGVLLTGMGSDGARGLLHLRQSGAHTIAQDEATSVVYGMPRVARSLDAALEILPIGRIADRVRAACQAKREG